MSMITRDNVTGEVSLVSISTIEKDGRTLLSPQMIDITDVKNDKEIYDLIMAFQANFKPEPETKEEMELRLAAEKAYGDMVRRGEEERRREARKRSKIRNFFWWKRWNE